MSEWIKVDEKTVPLDVNVIALCEKIDHIEDVTFYYDDGYVMFFLMEKL